MNENDLVEALDRKLVAGVGLECTTRSSITVRY